MGAPLQLEIVSRQRRLITTEVEEVRIPGVQGELGVLAGHTPLLTALSAGRVAYTEGGKERKMALRRGFAEVQPDRVTILAREAVLPEEVDVEERKRMLLDLGEKMKTATAGEVEELKEGLRFAEACLEIAGAHD